MAEKTIFEGGDFSHWNKDADKNIVNCEFFAQKLTEGSGILDSTGKSRALKYAPKKPCILYHVLVPNVSVEKQFTFFEKHWNEVNKTCGALGVAIDVEASTNYFPTTTSGNLAAKTMAEQFGKMVEDRLHRRPIVYCGDIYKKAFYTMIRTHDWGLWIARYAAESKLVNVPDIWQYTNKPYDKDRFYGVVNKLHSFLKKWGD